MMSFLSGMTAVFFFLIASRYYLIPDGLLRKVRIAFYTYLACFAAMLVLSEIYLERGSVVFRTLQFYSLIPLFGVTVLYAYVLEKRFRLFTGRTHTLEHRLGVLGIRLSADLKILWISDEAYELLGYSSHALIGKNIYSLVHEHSYETLEYLKYFMDSNDDTPVSLKIQLLYANGMTGWFTLVAQKQMTDSEVKTLRCAIQNITATVLQEDRLRLMQHSLDHAGIGVTISHLATREIIYVNQKDAEQHGYTVRELLSKDVRIYSPGVLKRDGMTEEPKAGFVTLNRHKDGHLFPVRLYSTLLTDTETPSKVTFCQKINELSPYETILLGDSELLVCVLDKSLKIYWMNDVFIHLLGCEDQPDFPTVEEIFNGVLDKFKSNTLQCDELVHKYDIIYGGLSKNVFLAAFHGVEYIFLVGKEDRR